MRTFRLLTAPCAALAILGTAAIAHGGGPEEPLEEVRVEGTRAGGFQSRTKEGENPRESSDLASLIEPLPGLHVRRQGANDAFASLSIRGSASSQVAVYLAGVPLRGGSDPTVDLGSLPLWLGAEVRVHRSFAPAALGPGSLGGTLEILPPSFSSNGGKVARTEIAATAGSFGTTRLRVADAHSVLGTDTLISMTASRSNGAFTYLDPQATAAAGEDRFATRENAGHVQLSGILVRSSKVTWAPDTVGRLTFVSMLQYGYQNLPGTVRAPTPFQRLDTSRGVSGMELAGGVGKGVLSVRAFVRREELSLRDKESFARATRNAWRTNDYLIAFGVSSGWRGRPMKNLLIEARADGGLEKFQPSTWLGAEAPPSARRTTLGVGADLEWKVAKGTLAASARLDGYRDTTPPRTDVAAKEIGGVRPSAHAGFEVPFGGLRLLSHVGYTSRVPSFLELYGNRGAFLGNPDLRAEAALTVDGGARFLAGTKKHGLIAEAVAFATLAENLILFVPQGAYGRARATNVSQASIRGAELSFEGRYGNVFARASTTVLATENRDVCVANQVGCVRPRLPGRPVVDGTFDAGYSFGPIRIGWGVDVVGGVQADLVGDVTVPSRVFHNAQIRWENPFGVRRMRVSLDGKNVLDARIGTYPGVQGPVRAPLGDSFEYPLPGRSIFATVRWVLGNDE